MSEKTPLQHTTSSHEAETVQRSPGHVNSLMASLPALLLFGIGLAIGPDPGAQPITAALQAVPGGKAEVDVVPLAQTMVVAGKEAASSSPLRGQLRPTVLATGVSPLKAQVARVLIRTGESVDVGDNVIQLSTGSTSRPPVRYERAQTAAERAQVAAAKQQDSLQAKLADAQERFRDAQARVDAAQKRMAAARDMVAKLKQGETYTLPDEPESRSSQPTGSSAAARVAVKARREADAASRDAERAVAKAATARRTLVVAEADVTRKKQQEQSAEANVEAIQKKIDAKTATDSELQAARDAASTARDEAASAARKASGARTELARLTTSSQTVTANAKRAADNANKLEQQVKPGERDGDQAAPVKRSGGRSVSIEEAARIVDAALEESDSAIKSAESIKREVDGYERQARITESRIDSSSSRLSAAQERVMENTIAANLSAFRAPASGVVTWVAPIATEVGVGDRLITVVQPDVLIVEFRDYSGSWRQLKEGDSLPAVVQTALPEPASSGRPSRTAAAAPSTPPADLPGTISTSVRLRSITPPAEPGGPALLRAAVHNPRIPGSNQRHLQSGMRITCAVTPPGADVALSIPVSAIQKGPMGEALVAVLNPASEFVEVGANQEADNVYRIEWREVTLGASSGGSQKVLSGLLPGDRIALQPAAMDAITRAQGRDAAVRLATA